MCQIFTQTKSTKYNKATNILPSVRDTSPPSAGLGVQRGVPAVRRHSKPSPGRPGSRDSVARRDGRRIARQHLGDATALPDDPRRGRRSLGGGPRRMVRPRRAYTCHSSTAHTARRLALPGSTLAAAAAVGTATEDRKPSPRRRTAGSRRRENAPLGTYRRLSRGRAA